MGNGCKIGALQGKGSSTQSRCGSRIGALWGRETHGEWM